MNDLKRSLINALNNPNLINEFYKVCYEVLFSKVFIIAYGFSKEYAKDITHDYFVKIMLLDISKFEAHLTYIERYLLKIAYNHCKDFLRRYKKKPVNNVVDDLSGISNQLVGDILSINVVDFFILNEYSIHLNKRQKKAILMKIKGFAVKEIAIEMKTTEGAVKNLIYRAKKIMVSKNDIRLR